MPGNYHSYSTKLILHLKTHLIIHKKENSFFHDFLTFNVIRVSLKLAWYTFFKSVTELVFTKTSGLSYKQPTQQVFAGSEQGSEHTFLLETGVRINRLKSVNFVNELKIMLNAYIRNAIFKITWK